MNWLGTFGLFAFLFWFVDSIADRIIGKLDSMHNELREISSRLEGLSDITQAIQEISEKIDVVEVDGKRLVPPKVKDSQEQIIETIKRRDLEYEARLRAKAQGAPNEE